MTSEVCLIRKEIHDAADGSRGRSAFQAECYLTFNYSNAWARHRACQCAVLVKNLVKSRFLTDFLGKSS